MGNKNHRKVEFNFKECLVGQSVNCLAYAYMHSLPVFGLAKYKPLEFDYIDPSIDLSPLMIENEIRTLKMLDGGSVEVGMDRNKLWHILSSHLSFAGLLPSFGMYDIINIHTNNLLKFSVNNKNVVVNSECILFFDVMDNLLFEVNDYLDINKNSNIDIDYFESTANDWPFFRQLYFYNTRRVAGRHLNKKDVCAKSIISKEKLDDFEYSETAIKFKVDNFLLQNLNKKANISLNRREIRPLFESVYKLDEVLNFNVEIDELRRLLYKHYICSPCDMK